MKIERESKHYLGILKEKSLHKHSNSLNFFGCILQHNLLVCRVGSIQSIVLRRKQRRDFLKPHTIVHIYNPKVEAGE